MGPRRVRHPRHAARTHPVKTYAIDGSYLKRVFNFMRKEMQAGHQIYVVCPLVEKSEKQDLASAVAVYEELRDKVFPDFKVGLVHGRMKGAEKDQVMNDFKDGKIKLLAATSVIEVGINVPNATIMFVYGADRFGLSQLHQLRAASAAAAASPTASSIRITGTKSRSSACASCANLRWFPPFRKGSPLKRLR